MGYAMSRYELDASMLDSGQTSGFYISRSDDEEMLQVDNEIRQLTNLRIEPNEPIRKAANSRKDVPVSTAKMLLGRESNWSGRGKFTSSDQCHVVSRYLPTNGPWHVDRMNSKAYISQFSTDGSLFVAAFQGSHLRVYNVDKGWKIQKDILAKSMRWTVTDTCLSPDQRFLVYASLSPIVHIVNVEGGAAESHANINELHDGLDFSLNNDDEFSFGIFSVKFSMDGRELVAGSSDDSIYVFDIQTSKVSLRIKAHSSDVNSVTFADETGHVLYSGSDDGLCKVWDRRCFIDKDHPAGVLVGHLEGITFIDSRGDGRYLISNGKDQTIKLWDIRKMSNNVHCPIPESQWDYRWMDYPYDRQLRHPSDQSLATYRGHSVLRTLIRCYFSPAYSTGQRYIYTGSGDNCVYIYDMVSGNQAAKLEYHDNTVRDCSWHPHYPTLVSSAWDGLIVRWEFSGSSDKPSLPRKRRRRRHIY